MCKFHQDMWSYQNESYQCNFLTFLSLWHSARNANHAAPILSSWRDVIGQWNALQNRTAWSFCKFARCKAATVAARYLGLYGRSTSIRDLKKRSLSRQAYFATVTEVSWPINPSILGQGVKNSRQTLYIIDPIIKTCGFLKLDFPDFQY